MKKTILSVLVMVLMLAIPVSAVLDMTVSFTPTPPSEVSTGGIVTYEYSVENLGPDDEENITVDWSTLTNGGVTMGGFSAGSSGLFDLLNGATFGPQQAQFFVPANQKAGTYQTTYELYMNAVLEDSDVVEVIVAEEPAVSLSAPANADLVQGQVGSFELSMQNTGNTDLSLTVSGPSFDDGNGNFLVYSVSQNPKSVDYSQSGSVDISFNVPANQAVGVYTTTLTVTDGSLSQDINVQVTVAAPETSVTIDGGNIDFGTSIREQELEQAFVVRNDGDVTLTNVVLSHNLGSEYDAQLSQTDLGSLAAGATVNVELELTLPDSEDAGETVLGQVTVTSDQTSFNANVQIEPRNMLEISDIEVEVGDKKKKSYDDGDIVKDGQPFDDVEVTIEIENLFDDSGDYEFDIENVQIELTIFDIDDEDDLELDTDDFDVDADDKETEKLDFQIPVTVDDDQEYDMEIVVEGEDENGAEHRATATLKLKIEKEKTELSFQKMELTPSTVSCEATTVLNLELLNLGADDEDDVVIRVKNDALNVNIFENVGDMSSDWDDDDFDFSKFYTINIPSDLNEGTYTLELEAYRDEDDLETIESLTLQKVKCSAPVEDDNDFEDFEDFEDFQDTPTTGSGSPSQPSNVDVVFSDAPVDVIPQAPGADDSNFVAATTVDSSDDEGLSLGYLVLLALGNVAVVVLILVLIARALKNRD